MRRLHAISTCMPWRYLRARQRDRPDVVRDPLFSTQPKEKYHINTSFIILRVKSESEVATKSFLPASRPTSFSNLTRRSSQAKRS